METRREFIKGLAAASVGLPATASASEGRDVSIAVYQSPELESWATEWPLPPQAAAHYVSRAVGALPRVGDVSTSYRGTLDVGETATLKGMWERVRGKKDDNADVTLYLSLGGGERYGHTGWGGSGVAVVRGADELGWLPELPDSGTGREHFAVSNVLHEVGHALGLSHADGEVHEFADAVAVSPMLSAYVYREMDVGDREVRYRHHYAGHEPEPATFGDAAVRGL